MGPRRGRGMRALLTALPYLTPAIAVLITFRFVPIFYGTWLSLTDGTEYVGLKHYDTMLIDPTLKAALINNFVFVATLPLWIVIPVAVAVLVHERIWFARAIMALVFIPTILSPVMLGVYYTLLLGYDGPVNTLLRGAGLEQWAKIWLVDPATAFPVVILIYIWGGIGVGVLFFVSALGNIDSSLQEAALLDGCRWTQRLRFITLPLLRPVFEFWATVSVIGIFTALLPLVFVLTSGGPGTKTMVVDLYIYQTAFSFNSPYYATAMGMTVFMITMVLVVFQLRLLRRVTQ